jgi:hypothetical protein
LSAIDHAALFEEVVKHIEEVDPTGQTFRYPESIKYDQHLKDWPSINLAVLEYYYTRLFGVAKDWQYRIDHAVEHAAQDGTLAPPYRRPPDMLHKEEFAAKFRIDQRIGIKDRVAIVSVDPDDRTKGFGLGGMDNQIFRTSQAGMYLKINNLRILSLSFDGFVSRYAGMPFPKELLALSESPDTSMALMEKTDYRVKQDWKAFDVPGATVIAQSSFWLANCTDDETFDMYINETTIPRYRRIPRLRKRADLEQFVRTHLISNATGSFRYHPNPRQKLRFGRAKDNTDWHFMRSLDALFIQEVLPLNPKRVVGTVRGAGPCSSRCSGSKRPFS